MNALHFALHDGWRLLRARPLGNLAAVLVLACGLSAVITVASLSHLVLGARPSSMPADRLLSVYGTGFGPASALTISGEEALAVRREAKGLGNTALLSWNAFNVYSHSGSATGRAGRGSGFVIAGESVGRCDWREARKS